MIKNYLNFSDLTAAECGRVLARAIRIKKEVLEGERRPYMLNKQLVMLFEKESTRTRLSFTAAMTQCGGQAREINAADTQMQRGESIADTARVLSSYADALMLRVRSHHTLEEFAKVAACPVINGLSDISHPCQILADVMTYQELRGELAGKKVAWIGDCNNVLYSWAEAAAMFGCHLFIACPQEYRDNALPAGEFADIDAAVTNADLVMTDVWVSLNDADADARQRAFADYRVSEALMKKAKPDALFMHCLPAHRGEEVDAAVIDGKQSAVWQQAENRLHAQKALLLELLEWSTEKTIIA